MKLIKLIKSLFMAKDTVAMKPIPTNDQLAALEAIANYKKQNPVKYEAKKAALFKKYGLDLVDEPEDVKDENDLELEAVKKKVTRAKKKVT